MAKKKPKRDRVVINGVPHRLTLFEVEGVFPNGRFRRLKRITEESTVRVDTPTPKWFVTAYIQESTLRYVPPSDLKHPGTHDA